MTTTEQTAPSVADLEAKVLAGESVSPEEMIDAQARDKATEHLDRLARQRDENAALEENRLEARERYKPLEEECKSLSEDATADEAAAEIVKAAVAFFTSYKDYNLRLARLVQDVRDLRGFAKAPGELRADVVGAGDAQCGNYIAPVRYNWEAELLQVFERAMGAAKTAEAKFHEGRK